jgi:hypothetical protein
MQGIYTYIPETNNVPMEYTVAAIPLLLFMVPISLVPALALLCFYVSTFRSMCAVIIIIIIIISSSSSGDSGSTVVKVLRYKLEGRWFDPRWCHGIIR